MLALAAPLAPAEESHALVLDGSTSGKQFCELYDVGGRLGSAELYTIRVVKHKQSDDEYAVKSVQRKRLQPGSAIALQDEIRALKMLKGCESIIALHDVFEEPDATFLVFECNMREGFLIDRVLKKTCYAEGDARMVCRNLLKGVQHCHDRRIANRNLKLENILLVVSSFLRMVPPEHYKLAHLLCSELSRKQAIPMSRLVISVMRRRS